MNMRLLVCLLIVVSLTPGLRAQTYADSLAEWRKRYVADLLADARRPIQPSQVKYLNFYPADPAYRVLATFVASPGSMPFMVQTHSGKQKPFREYGLLIFKLNGEYVTLHAYQSVDLVKDAAHQDELFIPFNDMTNYESTYPGGRYIDLSVHDIVDGKVWLDLNKCYNPYCAYADGYSCPIPPRENNLHVEVKAGEKMFIH